MADPDSAPIPRAGVYVEELGGEAVVYDRTGRRAIYLNATATLVWKLFDGERTVADISALFAKEYPDAAAEIERDVSDAVDQMTAARVVTLVQPNQDASDKPSST